jgi:hypothetical protein
LIVFDNTANPEATDQEFARLGGGKRRQVYKTESLTYFRARTG